MYIDLVELLGTLATVVSVSILIPTMVQQIRTRSTGGLSLAITAQAFVAQVLWLTYGAVISDTYMFCRSLVSMIFTVASIVLYFKYKT